MASRATMRVAPSRVLLVASFGAFLAFLDATIVNVACPSILESFSDTTIGELSWVLNAYDIVFAASLILCGRLTDLVDGGALDNLPTDLLVERDEGRSWP